MQHLERDGVALFYDEAGSGAPPILLVHGWTGDHTYLAPQFEHFRREHRTIAVDLRGHGRSDTPAQDYTMAGFADDLAWLCGELGVYKPVVVGHSMGGVVALELAARHPDLPAAIVALDSLILPLPEIQAAIASFTPLLRTDGFREAQRAFVAQFFGPADDAERKARILDGMSSAPQQVMASSWEDLVSCDTAAAAAACTAPLLYISAGLTLTDLARLRELCPHLLTAQTAGGGHFHQLEVPEQINAMIDRFLFAALPRPVLTA
jgi:pimeloyl-ACP methyl ester carboxylesterase